MVTSVLDTDFYKLTMGQMLYSRQPSRQVEFSFINRKHTPILGLLNIAQLNEEFEKIRVLRLTEDERIFLKIKPNCSFCTNYLNFLDGHIPSKPIVTYNNGLNITVSGEWASATLWEVPILATVNELYFEAKRQELGLSVKQVWQEGESRLREKAQILHNYPELKFVDFGTRRRYASDWHSHVIDMCLNLMPNNFTGTSNVALAQYFDIPVVGTMAHECFMGYSRLFGNSDTAIRDSHHIFLQDWWEFYGLPLSIALTDTFGSQFFFDTFTPEQAELWKGLRQDSGDPMLFGYKALEFYKKMGIDPKAKTIVFSDGLTFPKMIEIWNEFHNEFNVVFGIGTNLTNDMGLGLDPLSIVVKLSAINGLGTVKLSDNIAKAMGSEYNKQRFMQIFNYDNDYYEACVV